MSNIINILKKKNLRGALVPKLEGKTHLSQMVLDLFGKCKNYDIIIDIKELGNNSQGFPLNAQTDGIKSITLDEDLVKDATQLSIAKTLVHESLHVYINYVMKNNRRSTIYNELQNYYKNFRNQYSHSVANNLSQHTFISQYVEALAYSLSSYDHDKQDISYYKALSWGGLESSEAYKKLKTSEKTKIQQIIKNEQYARRDAKSTKCK